MGDVWLAWLTIDKSGGVEESVAAWLEAMGLRMTCFSADWALHITGVASAEVDDGFPAVRISALGVSSDALLSSRWTASGDEAFKLSLSRSFSFANFCLLCSVFSGCGDGVARSRRRRRKAGIMRFLSSPFRNASSSGRIGVASAGNSTLRAGVVAAMFEPRVRIGTGPSAQETPTDFGLWLVMSNKACRD